ncbi:2-hydroxyacyl-CoA dehydratase family protein [bacterium]|nr:2-hydroxyacyl-CoA dehydratase family protein [bacterium]
MKIPDRKTVIDDAIASGYRIGAVLPFHYPRALLRAYDIYPVELWGPPRVDAMDGRQHFPEYTCQIVLKATRFLLSPQADSVSCMLIPHTCDSLQGMASVIKDFIPMDKPVFTLYHPRGRRKSDLTYIEQELRSLGRKLEAFTGKSPDDKRLLAEIEREEAANTVFGHMCQHRDQYSVSDKRFYTCLRSREYLSPEQFIEQAQGLPRGRAELAGPRLMLSGIVPEPLDLFDHINGFGAHVVTDDLACYSRRIYQGGDASDPYQRLARIMISMPPDPTVSTPYSERFTYLTDRIRQNRVQGIIVYNPKFCEPELFYLPMLEDAVRAMGCSFLFIEHELSSDVPQQILNRINAFVETLT